MSHSNRHQFTPLTKASKALTGQRLSRIIAKAAKEESAGWIKKENGYYHPNLSESICISVPRIADSELTPEILAALKPHIVAILEDAQDAKMKELRLESGASEIADEEISIPSLIAYLDSNIGGGRITTEYLTEWFKDSYSLPAAEFVAGLLGADADMDNWTADMASVVEKKVNTIASMFAGFASGKYSPSIPQCRGMVRFGEFVSESCDARMVQFVAKAAKILADKEAELKADALGF